MTGFYIVVSLIGIVGYGITGLFLRRAFKNFEDWMAMPCANIMFVATSVTIAACFLGRWLV